MNLVRRISRATHQNVVWVVTGTRLVWWYLIGHAAAVGYLLNWYFHEYGITYSHLLTLISVIGLAISAAVTLFVASVEDISKNRASDVGTVMALWVFATVITGLWSLIDVLVFVTNWCLNNSDVVVSWLHVNWYYMPLVLLFVVSVVQAVIRGGKE